MSQTSSHDQHQHSIAGYIYVFLALCILTGASFFTYSSYWPFREPEQLWIGRTFMMMVSCTKAMLVILFFMHLKDEKSWKYVLTIPTMMMAIFLMMMLVPDIGRRVRNYDHARQYNAAEPADTTHHEPADSSNKHTTEH